MCAIFLLSAQTLPEENSNNAAEVPSFPPYSQINLEDWKADKATKMTKTGRIKQIINPLTLLLSDGTVIRLASLDIPDFANERDAPINDAALLEIKRLLPPKTEIFLFQTRSAKKGRVNRMDHQLVHIVTKKDNLWINGALLSQGLARHYTMKGSDELLNQMDQAESHAITENLGLWGLHPVLTAEQTPKHLGEFAVINATVEKVALVKNKLYLNFGKDWKTDFTVMLDTRMRKKLSQRGIDPMDMAGQQIQVRGWLREYNGAYIELEDISHLSTQTPTNPANENSEDTDPLQNPAPVLKTPQKKIPSKRMGQ